MESNKPISKFDLLIQSKDIEDIQKALQIAQNNSIEIEEKVINELYVYIRGPRPKTLPDASLSAKIKVINCCRQLHFYLKGNHFDLNQFQYLKNLEKVKVTFQCNAFQYIQVFLKNLFLHHKIEVLELVNYPLSFFPDGIEKLENLKVFKCISSKIEKLPSLDEKLSKLEELDFSNSTNINPTQFLKKLPNLKQLKLAKTNIAGNLDEIKYQYPKCEIIT